MRNLKRALSMALAAVMLLGMMVIGASAAGYSDLTDTDEIVNKEAVALLVDLGVIDGKSSGRYDPTGTLERVEFTKLVFGMMMGQNSDATVYEDAGIFSDVDTCWGEGFINYCASIGIVSGVGKDANGKDRFSPYSSLTVAATAKMLLVALGYHDDDRGYNGDAWTVNVMRDAQAMGLLDGVTGQSANDAITRDNAAQMIFNALFATTKNAVMLPGGNVGAETVAYYTDGPSLAESRYNGLYAVTEMLTNYGDTTETIIGNRRVAVESDPADVGTPVVYYRNNAGLVSSVAIAAQTNEILSTTYGDATLQELSERVINGKFSPDFVAVADEDVAIVYNNALITTDGSRSTTFTDANSASVTVDATVGKKGVVTKLIDTDGNGAFDVVSMTEKRVGSAFISTTTYTANGDLYVQISGVTNGYVPATDVYGLDTVESGDTILWYVDINHNYFVEPVEPFTGTMTASTNAYGQGSTAQPATFTVNGVVYELSSLTGTIANADPGILEYKGVANVTYWLDNGGHIIQAAGQRAPIQVLQVLKNNEYTAGSVFTGNTQESQVVFSDGTTGIISISMVDGAPVSSTNIPDTTTDGRTGTYPNYTFTDNGGTTNLYSYVQLADGTYSLTTLTNGKSSFYGQNILNGVPSVFVTDYQDSTNKQTTALTNDNTVYLVRNKGTDTSAGGYLDTYTVYTGYRNVPSMENAKGVAYISGSYVRYVYVNSYDTIATQARDVAYVLGENVTAVYKAAGVVDYYTVRAIVDGQIVDLKLAANATATFGSVSNTPVSNLTSAQKLAKDTLYEITGYDASGNATAIVQAKTTTNAAPTPYWIDLVGSNAAANGVILLGGQSSTTMVNFAYASDVVVYTINEAGTMVTTGGIDSIVRDSNDVINVVTVNSEYGQAGNITAKAIFVRKVSDAVIGGGGGAPTGTSINLTPAADISSVSVNGISLPAPTMGYTSLADAVSNATTISKTAFVTGVDGKYTFTVTEGSNASSMVTNVTAFANVASVPAALTSGATDGMTISPVLTVGNVIVVSAASAANTQAAWYVAYVIAQ